MRLLVRAARRAWLLGAVLVCVSSQGCTRHETLRFLVLPNSLVEIAVLDEGDGKLKFVSDGAACEPLRVTVEGTVVPLVAVTRESWAHWTEPHFQDLFPPCATTFDVQRQRPVLREVADPRIEVEQLLPGGWTRTRFDVSRAAVTPSAGLESLDRFRLAVGWPADEKYRELLQTLGRRPTFSVDNRNHHATVLSLGELPVSIPAGKLVRVGLPCPSSEKGAEVRLDSRTVGRLKKGSCTLDYFGQDEYFLDASGLRCYRVRYVRYASYALPGVSAPPPDERISGGRLHLFKHFNAIHWFTTAPETFRTVQPAATAAEMAETRCPSKAPLTPE